jgi:hypothetical protein
MSKNKNHQKKEQKYTEIRLDSFMGKKDKTSVTKDILFWVLMSSLFIYLGFNIYYTQKNLNSLYFSFVNEDRESVIKVLEKTRDLEVYSKISEYLYTSVDVYHEKIVAGDEERRQTISELEAVLAKNDKARDVLLAIAHLYKKNGNQKMYEDYMVRAQKVDPKVGN